MLRGHVLAVKAERQYMASTSMSFLNETALIRGLGWRSEVSGSWLQGFRV